MKRRLCILNAMTRKLVPSVLGVIVLLLLPHVAGAQAEIPDPTVGSSDLRLTVMSQELLDGIPVGRNARLLHVQGDLRALEGSSGEGVYQELFRVDTGATDSIAPANELERIGIMPVGRATYELPDGTVGEYSFGIARIEFMGEMREGRIIFGPEGVEPVLGVNALESLGFTVDPATQTLKRVPATEGIGQPGN